MDDSAVLELLISMCTVEEIDHGHNATFQNRSANFEATDGPNGWTRHMACRAAIFLWALDMRNLEVEHVTFYQE